MTPHMRDYLTSLTESKLGKLRRDSEKTLRLAWPHRHGLRGRIVVRANVTMLRNLRAL